MLADIKVNGTEQSGKITIELQNGRQIVGLTDGSDRINLVENTTELSPEQAQIAAAIAWVLQSEGEHRVVWRKFQQQIDKTAVHMRLAALRLNLGSSIVVLGISRILSLEIFQARCMIQERLRLVLAASALISCIMSFGK